MRIATYNFLGGGSRNRDQHWHLLQQHVQPDLLFAQECRPRTETGAETETGSWLWARAARRHWGTGLYARDIALEPITIRNFKGWVTGARIEDERLCRGRAVVAFSIHCPAGEHGYVRTMHTILDRLARFRKGADLLIGGDLNVACGYRDADDTIKMSRAGKQLLDRISDDFNLIPCWQTANPGKRLAQTLRWSANRKTPYHCDGIFIPASWRCNLQQCEVLSGADWDRQSDHNPVVATLEPAYATAGI